MRPRRRIKSSRTNAVRQGVIIAGLVLAAFWLGSLIWSLGGKAVFAWETAHDTQKQAQELATRRQALQKSIATLETPRGQAAAIRTAFGVARPGEQVIIVVPPQTATTTAKKPSWWQKVLGVVGL